MDHNEQMNNAGASFNVQANAGSSTNPPNVTQQHGLPMHYYHGAPPNLGHYAGQPGAPPRMQYFAPPPFYAPPPGFAYAYPPIAGGSSQGSSAYTPLNASVTLSSSSLPQPQSYSGTPEGESWDRLQFLESEVVRLRAQNSELNAIVESRNIEVSTLQENLVVLRRRA